MRLLSYCFTVQLLQVLGGWGRGPRVDRLVTVLKLFLLKMIYPSKINPWSVFSEADVTALMFFLWMK